VKLFLFFYLHYKQQPFAVILRESPMLKCSVIPTTQGNLNHILTLLGCETGMTIGCKNERDGKRMREKGDRG
jgi:hypothetical protein